MAALLRRPPADGQHCQQMIPAMQRMIEAVVPAINHDPGRMGMGEVRP